MSRTLLSLAGFQVILSGRFWVIAEATWLDRKKEWCFDRYIHCSPECRKKYAAFAARPNVLTADHLAVALGTEILASAEAITIASNAKVDETHYKGRCANQTCGSGRDLKGIRVRGRVPRIGDVCSKEGGSGSNQTEKAFSRPIKNGQKTSNFDQPGAPVIQTHVYQDGSIFIASPSLSSIPLWSPFIFDRVGYHRNSTELRCRQGLFLCCSICRSSPLV